MKKKTVSEIINIVRTSVCAVATESSLVDSVISTNSHDMADLFSVPQSAETNAN